MMKIQNKILKICLLRFQIFLFVTIFFREKRKYTKIILVFDIKMCLIKQSFHKKKVNEKRNLRGFKAKKAVVNYKNL